MGFRPGRPLPGPPELATRLREKALDAVERWNDNYGAFYQQAGSFCVLATFSSQVCVVHCPRNDESLQMHARTHH